MLATTTLRAIRHCGPSPSDWESLLRQLGKTEEDDQPLTLKWIKENLGLYFAIWCVRAVPQADDQARLLLVWYAQQWSDALTNRAATPFLALATRFAMGEAGRDEMREARTAWADLFQGKQESNTDAGHAVEAVRAALAISARYEMSIAAKFISSAPKTSYGDVRWRQAGKTLLHTQAMRLLRFCEQLEMKFDQLFCTE